MELKGKNEPSSNDGQNSEVLNLRTDSNILEKLKSQEVQSIRLSPDQIEEIHSDEYALTLFYATRVEPMTTGEIKRQFPEPEASKAQSVLDRFVKSGLIHITPEGKYYSNFPNDYINYSDYRYDSVLEATKDAKVFKTMKEFTGNKEFWKNRSYFSMDAFYTPEQTKELQQMFAQIRLKAKEYANENAKKKSIKGLWFRRLKFYDMLFSTMLVLILSIGSVKQAHAGGNDPRIAMMSYQSFISQSAAYLIAGGGGNDPTAVARFSGNSKTLHRYTLSNLSGDDDGGGGHDPTNRKPSTGGGGHDPADPKREPLCYIQNDGVMIPVKSEEICSAQKLLTELALCLESQSEGCYEVELQLRKVLSDSVRFYR